MISSGGSAAGAEATLSVRPEEISVVPGPREGDNTLQGTVTFVRDVGSSVEIYLECDGVQIVSQSTPKSRPAVRQGDDQWFTVVKWVLFAMINAEELGITQKNVDDMMKSTNPAIKRFVGTEGNYGEQLGLTKDWAVRIIKLVGNYGESFERNVGQGSPLKIERGLNKLWNQGGIQYAPPIR